jgi:hypothetical protein
MHDLRSDGHHLSYKIELHFRPSRSSHMHAEVSACRVNGEVQVKPWTATTLTSIENACTTSSPHLHAPEIAMPDCQW